MTTTNENKNYRMLEVGEVIEEGDEVVRGEKWQKVSISVGAHVSVFSAYCYRRLIPTPPLLLEVGKYYKTRGGEKVRVLAVDGKGVYLGTPQPVAVQNDDGGLYSCSKDGKFMTNEHAYDLLSPWVEVPEVGEGWRLVEDENEILLASDEAVSRHNNNTEPLKDFTWTAHGHTGTTLAEAREYSAKNNCTLYFRRRISPVVAWDKMPAWARWVGRGGVTGKWYWFMLKPSVSLFDSSWEHDGTLELSGEIPEQYSPTFSGDWKDSLVERKEGE